MINIFEIKDKNGKKINLTSERWNHILKHPEMTGKLESIKDTLIKPDIIINDFKYDIKVRFFYKYYKDEKAYLFISESI